MTKQVLNAIQSTPTAQLRRVTIPEARRRGQARQTLLGGGIAIGGMLFVHFLGLGEAWYAVALLLGLRVASREFLMDSITIAREVLGLKRD